MTTPDTFAATPQVQSRFRLPDPPEDPQAKMTSFDHLTITGTAYYLRRHLLAQRPDTADRILVAGDRYVVVRPTRSMAGSRDPDLLVAFDVDPQAYRDSNGYIIADQGKPPDLVMEIASHTTGRIDVGEKRDYYARLGIGEYWRFDDTGEHHGQRLAGDRLVGGEYLPMDIEELPDGSLKAYSPALDLHLRWEDGSLLFYDPVTERPIATFESEHEARADAETQRDAEHEARIAAEARALAAEARVRELEERLRGQGGQPPPA